MKVVIGLLISASLLFAAQWSSTKIELHYGTDYKVGDSVAQVVSFSHGNGWEYGDNFFWVDATREETDNTTSLYGEFAPRFSIFKIAGITSDSPLKDLSIAPQIEMGAGDFRYLAGVGTALDIPAFAFFNLNGYLREDPKRAGVTFQISASWAIPFTIGSASFLSDGFFDLAGEEGEEGNKSVLNFHTQPTLLLDLGNFWGAEKRLYIGTELIYWKNKFGIESTDAFETDEFLPQATLRWVF